MPFWKVGKLNLLRVSQICTGSKNIHKRTQRQEEYSGVARGNTGEAPPRNQKIVVEKWCHFQHDIENQKGQSKIAKNSENDQFSIEILSKNLKKFYQKFWFLLIFRRKPQNVREGQLHSNVKKLEYFKFLTKFQTKMLKMLKNCLKNCPSLRTLLWSK